MGAPTAAVKARALRALDLIFDQVRALLACLGRGGARKPQERSSGRLQTNAGRCRPLATGRGMKYKRCGQGSDILRPLPEDLMLLPGKVAIVTGAAQGIGQACAVRLAGEKTI